MNTKLDLYKLHKTEYVTPRKPALVRIKHAHYLAIEGRSKQSMRATACKCCTWGRMTRNMKPLR